MSPESQPVKQVLVIRRDLKMRRGKEIAQGAHAACSWLVKHVRYGPYRLSEAESAWLTGEFRKVTVQVKSEQELLELWSKAGSLGVKAHLITDSGKTEFHGVPTPTCLALGPDFDHILDPITGHLELY